VDDARRMSRRQRRGGLLGDAQNFRKILFPALQLFAQSLAFDVFGGDKMQIFFGAEFVNRQNIRMIERRSGFGLALETAQQILVFGRRFRQNLERDSAVEIIVERQINLAHPSFADLREDFVSPEILIAFKHGKIKIITFVDAFKAKGFIGKEFFCPRNNAKKENFQILFALFRAYSRAKFLIIKIGGPVNYFF
jgi:hypothetical protein